MIKYDIWWLKKATFDDLKKALKNKTARAALNKTLKSARAAKIAADIINGNTRQQKEAIREFKREIAQMPVKEFRKRIRNDKAFVKRLRETGFIDAPKTSA